MTVFTFITLAWTLIALGVGITLIFELSGIRAAQILIEKRGLNGAMKSILRRDTRIVAGRLSQAFGYTLLGVCVLVLPGTAFSKIVFTVVLLDSLAVLVSNTYADRAKRKDIAKANGG